MGPHDWVDPRGTRVTVDRVMGEEGIYNFPWGEPSKESCGVKISVEGFHDKTTQHLRSIEDYCLHDSLLVEPKSNGKKTPYKATHLWQGCYCGAITWRR
jgi:hypothetical protein